MIKIVEFADKNMRSKKVDYAPRAAMCVVQRSGELKTADSLAEKTKVPRKYLTRVPQDLAATGLVSSCSGPGGATCQRRKRVNSRFRMH